MFSWDSYTLHQFSFGLDSLQTHSSAKDFADDKKLQMTFWVKCLKLDCDGELTRVRTAGPYGFYWYCKKCKKTYGEIDDNGIPVDKSKQG